MLPKKLSILLKYIKDSKTILTGHIDYPMAKFIIILVNFKEILVF